MSELIPEVAAMNKINFSGNVIPSNWYGHLRYDSGKTNLNAIIILSEIVYWYRPSEVRDEETGQLLGYKKKFKADKLQRSYSSFSRQFGLTKKQVRDALGFLENKGLITKELRTIVTVGITLSNVLFIGIVPTKIQVITLEVTPMTSKSHPPNIKVTPAIPESQTYTKSTTETTNRDISLEKKSSESEPFSVQTEEVDYTCLVPVFDSDNNVIPEMRDILVKMSGDGLVDHRSYEANPEGSFFHWVDNGLPVGNIPYGVAKKYGYELPESRSGQENVDEETHMGLGPHPQVLARYASEVAGGAAETLDKEIMGEDTPEAGGLDDVFGENPRQDEIDAHKAAPRMTPEELLLASMGGGVPPEIRAKLAQIRDGGWQVRNEQVETLLAQFFEITGFEIPSNKAQRKLFEVGARDHLDETLFEGRISELYKVVWDSVLEDVSAGDLVLTHPRAFSKLMYGAVNREAGRDMSKGPAGGLTRNQVLHVFQNEGLVEVKEVEGTGKHDFFWKETGEPVGQRLPRDLIDKYILSKSSV